MVDCPLNSDQCIDVTFGLSPCKKFIGLIISHSDSTPSAGICSTASDTSRKKSFDSGHEGRQDAEKVATSRIIHR